MRYKSLGATTTMIPVIGQGCMGIGGYTARDTSQDTHYIAMLREGCARGMTFIDTAESYGDRHSEELVGRAIQGQREKVIIATKVSPENLSYSGVLLAVERSLRRLQTDYIDLYQIHWPNPLIPLHETLSALRRVYREGVIRAIGVSNFSLVELKHVQSVYPDLPISSLQVEYSLFDRTIEQDLLPYCTQENIMIIAYSPLDKGRLATHEGLSAIAAQYNATAAQMALRWLTEWPGVVAIPKATTLQHIEENAAAADIPLQLDDFHAISSRFNHGSKLIPARTILVGELNGQRFVPNPLDLADAIKQGCQLKPVRVVPLPDKPHGYHYRLVEGELRYWAWMFAYQGHAMIPALIREEEENE